MRTALLWATVGCVGAIASVASCDDSTPAADVDAGAADASSISTDATVDAAPDAPAPPVPSPFGLDTRPSNATCLVRARPPLDTAVKLAPAFPGLTFAAPLALLQAPGDPTRFYVVEKGGAVRTFPANATAQAQVTDFIRLPKGPGNVINDVGEGGLLGMAFHPSWAQNREVFLSYTSYSATSRANMRSVVARFKSLDNGQTLSAAADEIMTFDQPFDNHNGGNAAFGPDGFLYIGFGDGGSGGDPQGNGQNKNTLLGKMLRVDVNGAAPPAKYRIPPSNPFAAGGGKPEIFAYGFRNPWRWSFDRATGDLWLGDVGQATWEEIDRVQIGGNYGWNEREGTDCYGGGTACAKAGMIDPIVQHGRADAQSITGGYVYRGAAMPSLVGTYIYGDFGSGNIWGIVYDAAGKASPKKLAALGQNVLSSFGEGLDGELYVASFAGTIQKLVPSAPPAPSTFPTLLSQTGCVDPTDAKKPAKGLIPYEVNAQLWSDGAAKERFFALPDAAKITVGANGDWDFPQGSVLVKTFLLGGKRIETRLFMRHDDGGWAGYTYEWNDAQTDATLLPASKSKTVGTATWSFPSRSQCLQCHTEAAGGTLGLETAQLNRDAVYAETNRVSDQLATLDHLGLFVKAPTSDAGALPKLASPDAPGAGALAERARAYLHANCSHCHQPNGGGRGTMDLRYWQPFPATKTCNENPKEGDLGVAGAKVLTPGSPAKSIISLRMHATDARRMPPVASHVLDPVGSKVIDDWISSLTACP